MQIEITATQADFLIINKPPGLTVHPGDQTPKNEPTLVDFILKEYPEIKNVGQPHRPGVVHRLDKETSGIMVLAKTNEAYQYFVNQFKEKKIQKEYLALVYGKIKKPKGAIVYSIVRSKKNHSKFTTGPGRDARTNYRVINYCLDPKLKQEYTYLKAFPKTGRTHQIRVHLKAIGHPIVSDQKYCFKNQKKINPLPRLFLHALKITFVDPKSGKKITYEVPLAADLKKYLDSLTCLSLSADSPGVVPQP